MAAGSPKKLNVNERHGFPVFINNRGDFEADNPFIFTTSWKQYNLK
jgi:hypothetical protein